MSKLKNLLGDSTETDRLINIASDMIKNGTNFKDDIYLNLEYPGLADFVDFFSADFDSLPMSNDENYYVALYRFYKIGYKKLPGLLAKSVKGKKINLREFLIEVFFEAWYSEISKIPNCVNKHPEDLAKIIDWAEIKEKFPLASKSNYHLLHNKTFLEDVKKKFLWDYCGKNPEFYESIMELIKDIENPKDLHKEFIEALSGMVDSSDSIELYIKDYLLFDIFNRFYMDNEKKKNRLNKKNDTAEITNEEKKKIFREMANVDEIEQISNTTLLSEEEKNIINLIIQKFNMVGEKEKKKIKKYIMRLTVKKKPFKVGRFLKNNNFKELPEGVIGLLDDLMLDIIDEKSENEENLGNENEGILKSDENEEVISIDTVTHGANKEIFDLFMKNPVSAVIEKAKLCNYNIENENLLRKQIEPLCNSSKNLRDALLITLLKKSFSRPILKHSGLYSLRVGGIGYRFVLKQDFEGKFTIVGFYNHDDYEKVLDGRMG